MGFRVVQVATRVNVLCYGGMRVSDSVSLATYLMSAVCERVACGV